jgi:hypothetical protein
MAHYHRQDIRLRRGALHLHGLLDISWRDAESYRGRRAPIATPERDGAANERRRAPGPSAIAGRDEAEPAIGANGTNIGFSRVSRLIAGSVMLRFG